MVGYTEFRFWSVTQFQNMFKLLKIIPALQCCGLKLSIEFALGSIYVPHEGSPHYDDSLFDDLMSDVVQLNSCADHTAPPLLLWETTMQGLVLSTILSLLTNKYVYNVGWNRTMSCSVQKANLRTWEFVRLGLTWMLIPIITV